MFVLSVPFAKEPVLLFALFCPTRTHACNVYRFATQRPH